MERPIYEDTVEESNATEARKLAISIAQHRKYSFEFISKDNLPGHMCFLYFLKIHK